MRNADKLNHVRAIRCSALNVLKIGGTWRAAGDARIFFAERGGLKIGYHSAFSCPDGSLKTPSYAHAVLSQSKPNLLCGLDVWFEEKKVLNVGWNDAGDTPLIVSFKRGAWELELAAWEMAP
jgi:hypothetical protein